MTCAYCQSWSATTERQLATRFRNMAASPDATPFPCPQCGGTDWATTREHILPPLPANFFDRGTHAAWRFLRSLGRRP